ncbi:MAG TPA: bifunctional phosphoribosylaminoimidazolecarboxamide formyltransferase/IMP cyclohydrolase [Alphaproteobacteria bacterium]|nr:bifunctional phosphoribosylaminoimidazolecarboxamide formyltransferase/IMP cyclohydrolase [Alphaproteobacteria bacterium]
MAKSKAMPIRRALVSVSDKTGLIEFSRFLIEQGVEILSTGGTAGALRKSNIPVLEVADHTHAPEIMGGRIKTLHPLIHGGILARRDEAEDNEAMEFHGIAPIDLVVVTLYPFEQMVREGRDIETCIDNIDIGGPAMIRSAAKNHKWVGVITDPSDYQLIMDEMNTNQGRISLPLRQQLASSAFARTAAYDATISNWFNTQLREVAPEQLNISGKRRELLRYGENPHQTAAFYVAGIERPGVGTARQLQGKALSYNNFNDTDAAFELVAEFDRPAVAIIKHTNPCGVALGNTPFEAYQQALSCDPNSAFGGVIAFNCLIDKEAAEAVVELFSEVVIAPDADERAQQVFRQKNNLRLLLTGAVPEREQKTTTIRSTAGGFLVQDRDQIQVDATMTKIVTKRSPTPSELTDLLFAFKVCKHVKSNAIVYAKGCATIGIGAGQMSRVDSSRIAAWKAQEAAKAVGEKTARTLDTVVASDAFFPFADGLLAAVEAGARAVIQPGGSIRDQQVIAAADSHDVAMVFTGIRHFRH